MVRSWDPSEPPNLSIAFQQGRPFSEERECRLGRVRVPFKSTSSLASIPISDSRSAASARGLVGPGRRCAVQIGSFPTTGTLASLNSGDIVSS